ncbi:MAG: radical SAM protein [Myxococcota bacterium]|nr:radical SAM protein [Myxococcota bacterium]
MSGARRVVVVWPGVSVARDFIDYPWFADLGAVQIAAVLRAAGHDVALVDAYALPGATLTWRSDGRARLGAPRESIVAALDAVEARRADAVVVALSPFHRPPARDDVLAEALASVAGARVLLADLYQSGQHHVEADGAAVLRAYPEACLYLKYEAERTLPQLVEADALAPGVVAGEPPAVLDELPLPAWDLVDLDAHDRFRAAILERLGRRRWEFPIDGRTLPLITSRGCPYRCIHCSSNPGRRPGEPKTQRRLSAATMRAHLRALAHVHGAGRVHLLDEMINACRAHFEALLDACEELDLRVEIPNGVRADHLEEADLARLRGRITTLSISAESGSQRVLDEIVGKRLRLDDVERAARMAHAAAVPLLVHWIIGLPRERPEEINETLERAVALYERYGAWPAVQFATPLPGTRLAEGRLLPVVDDWGPSFQRRPSQPDALVDARTLHAFRHALQVRLRAVRGPEKLIVNVTYACNNHCRFCAVGTRTPVHGWTPRLVAHLVRHRRAGVRHVDFDGGEPTLHPDLLSLVGLARRLGYERVHVTTNGRRLADPDYARALLGAGVSSVLFSLHGASPSSHGREVGVAEAFGQTLDGIRNAVRLRPDGVELGVNVTLTRGNVRELGRLAELVWSLGLRWLNVQWLTPFGRATRSLVPDETVAAMATARLLDAWADRMKLQVVNCPPCLLPGYERFVLPDLGKHARNMVFVNNDEVNLAQYLGERRVRRPVCAPCPHRVACGGFYELDDVPEPPWIVTPQALVRPVRTARL